MGTFLHSFNRRAGTIFFGFSSIVCLARVAAGVHYPLDIIVGALVGIATASVVIVYGLPILRYDIPRVIRQNT